MRKVSQKDIAESLNLSRVTVTKALKDHPDIAVKTIEKVKDKALEMGYIPDFIGRSLSSSRTYTIGIVIPKIAHSFFSYSIEKIYESAHKIGYNIIPMVSFEDQAVELENIRTLLSMRVDGIILDIAQNSTDNKGYELAMNSGCSIVFYDRCPAHHTDGSIVTNDREAAYELTQHLIEKGYRKIYHFAGPSLLNISDERRKGFEDAMNESNLLCHILNVEMQRKNGYEAFMRMVKNNELPDAIFAINDPVAHGIYDAAAELGMKIPGDIAVAGFGDLHTSALLTPSMTTVKPPLDDMAEAAVEMLVKMMDNNCSSCKQEVFKAKIIIRDST
ncbi:LacI family DNA-binding transcriptional regulator [Bacteroidota bacterium]